MVEGWWTRRCHGSSASCSCSKAGFPYLPSLFFSLRAGFRNDIPFVLHISRDSLFFEVTTSVAARCLSLWFSAVVGQTRKI